MHPSLKLPHLKTYTVLLVSLLVCLTTAFAQPLPRGTVSGQVNATANKPLEFTTMMLLKAADSTLVKGAISDVAGKYAFENVGAGWYLVLAQQVGFRKTYSAPFAIDAAHPALEMPALTPKSRSLSSR